MSNRAEEAAMKAYPNYWKCYPFETNKEARAAFIKGYEQSEKDTLERAIEWWRPRLCGFLKEGLTEGVLEEFRNAMEEE